MLSFNLLLAAISALATVSSAQKSILVPEDYRHALAVEYDADVAPAEVTRRNVWSESIPEDCLREMLRLLPGTNQPRCAVPNIRVVQYWFADTTARSWVTCKCSTTPYDEAFFVRTIGQIPVGMRQYVRFFIGLDVFPGSAGAHMRGNDMTFFQISALSAAHEVGHAMDYALRAVGKGSTSAAFVNAVAQDTCWISLYAKNHYTSYNNLLEAWSDTFAYVRWQRHIGSFNQRIPGGTACISASWNVIQDQTNAIVSAGYVASRSAPESGVIVQRVNAGGVTPFPYRK